MQQCIDRAVILERHQGCLRRSLQHSLPTLHHTIQLPRRNAPLRITCFAIRYIQVIPTWLRQMEVLCDAAGIDLRPVRELIDHRFAEPADRRPDRTCLLALLQKAYLAHRTLEEVNERLQPMCGAPLLPMDPMVANLVIRELLGEELACHLDAACENIVRKVESVDPVLCKRCPMKAKGEWLDFARQQGIALRLPVSEQVAETIH